MWASSSRHLQPAHKTLPPCNAEMVCVRVMFAVCIYNYVPQCKIRVVRHMVMVMEDGSQFTLMVNRQDTGHRTTVGCACVAGPTTRDPGCVVHAFSCVCVGVHLRVSPSSLWIRLTRPTPLGRPGPTQPSGARDTVVPPTGRRNMAALGQQGHQGLDPGTKIAGRQGVRQTCVQSTGAEQEGQQLKTNGAKDNNNQT